jgi:hypothetical protein
VAKLVEAIQQHTHNGEDLVDFMLQTFRSGPMRYRMEAAHWLTERGFGKPPQVVEHTGDDGDPISVKVTCPRGEAAYDARSEQRKNSGPNAGRASVREGRLGEPRGAAAGSKTYAVRQLVAEALSDPDVWKEAVERYRETLKTRKTIINALEFAARVNREIRLGSEERVGGVTIIFQTNLKPGSLKRPANVRV